jgi:hypothetical protein
VNLYLTDAGEALYYCERQRQTVAHVTPLAEGSVRSLISRDQRALLPSQARSSITPTWDSRSRHPDRDLPRHSLRPGSHAGHPRAFA